jgi:hypothetical protein
MPWSPKPMETVGQVVIAIDPHKASWTVLVRPGTNKSAPGTTRTASFRGAMPVLYVMARCGIRGMLFFIIIEEICKAPHF